MIRVLRETHDTPADVAERIAQAGGSNLYGEPNFRVVWGWNRLTWIGGRWTDRDANGNVIREVVEERLEPKNIAVDSSGKEPVSLCDRWFLERWMPPSSYGSPETWWQQTLEDEDGVRVPGLGPYPARGDYEHVFTLAGPKGEFIPLTAAAVDYVVQAVKWAKAQPRVKRKESLLDRESRKEREMDRVYDEILE